MCRNGATCVNINNEPILKEETTEKNLFSFKCECALGYFGEYCEKSN